MAIESKAIADLVSAITPDSEDKRSNTYSAIVSRVDNEGVIWVRIAGSDRETPTASTSAEVKANDSVNVEWRNNKLYIAGNVSNPSAGTMRVRAVEQATRIANEAAQSAIADAGLAHEAASKAQVEADEAQASAEDAQKSADKAKQYADTAFVQLGIVEDVVGVLDLIAKNGDYEPTEDTEIQESKWYFIRSGTDPDYEYEVVTSPTGDPSAQDWYELIDIKKSIQNYVSSHMVLLPDGLWLQADNNDAKIHLRTTAGAEGVVIYGADNTPLAQYGSTSIIGDPKDFHIEIDGQVIGFYKGDVRVAFMKRDELYVENNLSFGHFVFTERANGHFTLKLID